jgi:hypothetical protein
VWAGAWVVMCDTYDAMLRCCIVGTRSNAGTQPNSAEWHFACGGECFT